jgi:GTP cyclohydrolase I
MHIKMSEKLTDKQQRIANAVKEILSALDEDLDREGLLDTPKRVAKMYEELLVGYQEEPLQILGGGMFESPQGFDIQEIKNAEPVIITNIPFYSVCEHHLLPFTGFAHLAYIPKKHIIGLSKIPRLVDIYTKRLQVQERISEQIADGMVSLIDPAGVFVVLEAEHTCASLRGVKKLGMNFVTTAARGVYTLDGQNPQTLQLRNELLQQIARTPKK